MKWIGGFLGAIFLGLAIRDAWGWLPRLSRLIIWLETTPLPKERRLLRREEWYAELAAEYEDRRLSGLLWTLKLCPISIWERTTTPLSTPKVRVKRADGVALRRTLRKLSISVVASWVVAGLVLLLRSLALSPMGAAAVGVSIALAGALFASMLTILGSHDRRRREDRDLQLALRRIYVLDVLDELGHKSQAASIRQLRSLREDLGIDAVYVDPDGQIFFAEAKHYAA
ncbi:MAG: hypothetical protein ACJ768_14180 [Gaiellaceae bacterium]